MSAPLAMVPPVPDAGLGALVPPGAAVLVTRARPPLAKALPSAAYRPKDLLLGLLGPALEQQGCTVRLGNPHFLPVPEAGALDAVLHLAPVEESCPLPGARNVQLLDRSDLLMLVREELEPEDRRLSRMRLAAFDALAVLADPLVPVPHALFPPGLPVLELALPPLPKDAPLPAGTPMATCPATLYSGNYNYLHMAAEPEVTTTRLQVLVEAAARRRVPQAVLFADPASLPEAAAAIRAFAAVPGQGRGARLPDARLLVCWFGTPASLAEAIRAQAPSAFFGDNFQAPGVTFLFAPFEVPELAGALAAARVVVDTTYGGVAGALARAVGNPAALVVGTGGRHILPAGELPAAARLEPAGLFSLEALWARARKPDRSAERALAVTFATLLANPGDGEGREAADLAEA